MNTFQIKFKIVSNKPHVRYTVRYKSEYLQIFATLSS